VALKVLPYAGMLDPRQLQRFHNEAQAAACLHHTNIVPVYFVGSERGVHFFAMQFIDGQTLAAVIRQLRQPAEQTPEEHTTAYQPADHPSPAADTEPLTRQLTRSGAGSKRGREFYRQVAELGAQAAEALDHAHQMGIVHRDVKPGNLLLDNAGRLWVTDFGLAHIQHGEASLTMTGDLVGTLRYMSPEQALAKRAVIDHRTDVYSLGATLYELLALEPVFGGKDRQELLRQIAFEEPRRPRRLNKAVPRELETVVLKAMEKNPGDRYATAQELADDLERWLKDEPIRARRPTVMQRLRRWARRHRPVVAGLAGGLLMLLVLGIVLAFAYQRRLTQTERGVTAALAQAETFLEEGDEQIDHPERWLATVQRAELAVERAEEVLATGPATEELAGRVREMRAAAEAAVTDSHLLVQLDRIRLEQAVAQDGSYDLARVAPLYAELLRKYGVDPAVPEAAAARVRDSRLRKALLAALADWSAVTYDTQDEGEVRRLWKVYRLVLPPDSLEGRLRAAVERHDGTDLVKLAKEPGYQDLPPATLVVLARLLVYRGEWAAAEQLLRAGLERKPADFWLNHWLGTVLLNQQPPRAEEAVRYRMAALVLRSESAGAHMSLGDALSIKGDLDEAIRRYQAALQINPKYAPAHNHLGVALYKKGDLDGAIACYRTARDLDPKYAEPHASLGNYLHDKGDLDGAIACYQKAIDLDPKFAQAHSNLGNVLANKGDLDGAIAEYRKAIALDPKHAYYHTNLGGALRDKKDLDRAIAEHRKAVELDPKLAQAHFNLGLALYEKKDLDGASAAFRKAIDNDPKDYHAHANLGGVLLVQGYFVEARTALRRCLELQPEHDPTRQFVSRQLQACERFAALDEKLAAVLGGQAEPSSAAERTELASLCQHPARRLYVTAARFAADAFAADARLAADLSQAHRYNAACAAAIAGCGQGKDAEKLDDRERTRLRQQALTWLRADLAAWRKAAEAKLRPVVRQRMQHWLGDTDFAGVRDPQALAKLPETERQEWQKLWADVNELFAKTGEMSSEQQK
jgi:tetratricopeptide (TPR) repeat protein